MLRTMIMAACIACLLSNATSSFAQCLIPPPLESCNGTEPSLLDNETLVVGNKKWYYGAPVVYNQVTLRGGTLVVCSDITFNNFVMDSGTIVIRPGARLRLVQGAGIILRGNSSIYNHGTFECTTNLSLDPNWATPSKPNVVINATPASVFKMNNQYFTINNTNSFFVNRGRAEFWGLITDYGAGMGSVCLGRFSEVRMAVLYNNRRHTYIAPEGAACVSVFQYSQFRDTLTNSMNVNICLSATHNSDATCIPHGCRPNAWGTPNIFQFCDQCSGITLLEKNTRSDKNDNSSRSAEIKISPNPFADRLTIKWKGERPVAAQVYNASGLIVYNKKLQLLNAAAITLDLPAGLPAGNYLVKLVYEKMVLVRQVVKTD